VRFSGKGDAGGRVPRSDDWAAFGWKKVPVIETAPVAEQKQDTREVRT
jgi:hypothetical protein